MKKKLVAGSVLIIIIAILAMGTYAYLVSEARATNVITTGTVKLLLTEYSMVEGEDGQLERGDYVDELDNVMPGETVSKIPVIQNTGTADFWTRMKIEAEIKVKGEGDGEGIINNPLEYITLDIDTDHWVYNEEDGWYYYMSSVAPGEEALPLFETVLFNPGMGNEFQGSSVEIVLDAQAVQSKNNPLIGSDYSSLWFANEPVAY